MTIMNTTVEAVAKKVAAAIKEHGIAQANACVAAAEVRADATIKAAKIAANSDAYTASRILPYPEVC